MYRRLPEIPAKFEPFMKLLEAAKDKPLSDRKKEVCLERLEAVRLMTSLTGNGVPHESPEVRRLTKKFESLS